MGYEIKEGGSFGCLASVTSKLHCQVNPPSSLTMQMYSRENGWCPYPIEVGRMDRCERIKIAVPYVKAAIAEAARALPTAIFLTTDKREEMIESGEITVTPRSTAAAIHSRMAPFRIFIERPESIEFFNEAKQHGSTLAAFIACHFYAINRFQTTKDRIVFQEEEGWHQSMFPDSEPDDLMSCANSLRRVVALYPQYRNLLAGTSTSDSKGIPGTISQSYVIPGFRVSLTSRKIRQELDNTMPDNSPPNPNVDMAGCVAWFQVWHDTIVRTCKEINNEN